MVAGGAHSPLPVALPLARWAGCSRLPRRREKALDGTRGPDAFPDLSPARSHGATTKQALAGRLGETLRARPRGKRRSSQGTRSLDAGRPGRAGRGTGTGTERVPGSGLGVMGRGKVEWEKRGALGTR